MTRTTQQRQTRTQRQLRCELLEERMLMTVTLGFENDGYKGGDVAFGDFNRDGFVDIAEGMPFVDANGIEDAGVVKVTYGSKFDPLLVLNRSKLEFVDAAVIEDGGGFSFNFVDDAEIWHQNSVDSHCRPIKGVAETGDHFGWDVAVGDFNGDGFDDLAIGVPGEDIGRNTIKDAGAVNVLYGGVDGLSGYGNRFISQNGRTADVSETGDRFGWSLATGNFNGDASYERPVDDLAIGVPGEDLEPETLSNTGDELSDYVTNRYNSTLNAGAVNVLYGSSNGLVNQKGQFWTQADLPNIISKIESGGPNHGAAENDDMFGYALAAGNFNGDRRSYGGHLPNQAKDDLAIGVPGEDLNHHIPDWGNGELYPNTRDAGAVNVLYGQSHRGLDAEGNQFIHQNPERYPRAGRPVDVGTYRDGAGTLHTTFRSGHSMIVNDRPWAIQNMEAFEHFGASLASGNFDGDRARLSRMELDDLSIGTPDETARGVAGTAYVIPGSTRKLNEDSFAWATLVQDLPNHPDQSDSGDFFGTRQLAFDFNQDGRDDLAIGVPGEDAVDLFFGTSFDGGGFSDIVRQTPPIGGQGWADNIDALFKEFHNNRDRGRN